MLAAVSCALTHAHSPTPTPTLCTYPPHTASGHGQLRLHGLPQRRPPGEERGPYVRHSLGIALPYLTLHLTLPCLALAYLTSRRAHRCVTHYPEASHGLPKDSKVCTPPNNGWDERFGEALQNFGCDHPAKPCNELLTLPSDEHEYAVRLVIGPFETDVRPPLTQLPPLPVCIVYGPCGAAA